MKSLAALAAQYGYQVFALISLVSGPMIGLYVKRRGAAIDVEARKETGVIDAQMLPVQLLKDELALTRKELVELRTQDKAEREQYIETLTAMKGALEQIAADLKASREDARSNASHVHQRLDVMDDRLLVIETQLAVKKPT